MGTSVLIVEDEPEFLRRFSDAVMAEPALQLAGAVSTVAAARALIDGVAPQVVLTDLGLPDGHGIEVIRHAMARNPQCDVLVVTMFGDDGNVIDSIAAGATGYLMKDALPEHIATSILEVRAGGSPISPAIARRVLQRFRVSPAAAGATVQAPASGPASPQQQTPLSLRETEILRLVAKGLSFKDVGEILAISPHTVVTHVKRVYQKLAVHSRGEAVYEANQLGLL
ncbi:MAG: response regulator transcription factor [Pseudomonadota bacterium]|uniref:LuxR C-terminal-related transcriptional regulator n=1 Tax=Polaromonas sp. TaxID=1869339 RepID=UPI00184E46A0|nr:response regulator transcription factor [Polaromonas sp.]MBA3594455.1 response regulator transcription factor [Polaromonas sp.]MDQ3271171.1 response regulator transcription factor [Pseudomonadota bacterium]